MNKGHAQERERPQPVPSNLFTREYFTSDCDGYTLWLDGSGDIPLRLAMCLDRAKLAPGMRILDIGCGRGELVCEAAVRGCRAFGLDYSEAALELARERADAVQGTAGRATFLAGDAKELPFADASFDRVFMVDVYEHLHPYEIEETLAEVHRILRAGGKLIVHTGPNTWFYSLGLPIARLTMRALLGKTLPTEFRGEYDAIMHVNEQNPVSLRRGLIVGGFDAHVRPVTVLAELPTSLLQKLDIKMSSTPAGFIFGMSLYAEARPLCASEPELRAKRMAELLALEEGEKLLTVGEREARLARGQKPGGIAVTCWERCETDEKFPFPDGSFDALSSQFILDEAQDPAVLVREFGRVLREGGRLALCVRNTLCTGPDPWPGPRPRQEFTPRRLARLLEEEGLEVTSLMTLVPWLGLPVIDRKNLGVRWHGRFRNLPYFRWRGRLLFVGARKPAAGNKRRAGKAGG